MTLIRVNHGKGHSYWLQDPPPPRVPEAIKLPGVTTILGQRPKDALIGWAARTTAEYAIDHWAQLNRQPPSARLKALNGARFEDVDQAARKGTAVHRLAEQLVAGRRVDVPEPLAGHVDSYVRFLDRFGVEPVAIELVVANRTERYCGTADLVAMLMGATWLLELKTSRSGIFPESALQAAGYQHAESYTSEGDNGAEHPLADLGIERCGAVHVRADGYDLRPLDTGPGTWATFQHLAWLHWHADQADEWVGEAVEPLRLVS